MLNMVAGFLASKPHAVVVGNQAPQNVLDLQSKSSAWMESRKSRRVCSSPIERCSTLLRFLLLKLLERHYIELFIIQVSKSFLVGEARPNFD